MGRPEFSDITKSNLLANASHAVKAREGHHRAKLATLEARRGPIASVRRLYHQGRISVLERSATREEARVERQIELYKAMKSNPRADTVYLDAIIRASETGKSDLAGALQDDYRLSAERALLQPGERPVVAQLIEQVALAVADDSREPRKLQLAEEGERGLDLAVVHTAYDVLGLGSNKVTHTPYTKTSFSRNLR